MKGRGKTGRRSGLSPAVSAIILVVAAIVVSLLVFALSSGMIGGFAASAKVVIEKVDVIINPATDTAIVLVDVRNAGGVQLTCNVQLTGPTDFTPVNVGDQNVVLKPGATATFRADNGDNVVAGQWYAASVTCKDPGDRSVSDVKQVVAHI